MSDIAAFVSKVETQIKELRSLDPQDPTRGSKAEETVQLAKEIIENCSSVREPIFELVLVLAECLVEADAIREALEVAKEAQVFLGNGAGNLYLKIGVRAAELDDCKNATSAGIASIRCFRTFDDGYKSATKLLYAVAVQGPELGDMESAWRAAKALCLTPSDDRAYQQMHLAVLGWLEKGAEGEI